MSRTYPAVFEDPYVGPVADAVIGLLRDGAQSPPVYDVLEYEGDLDTETGVSRMMSRVTIRPTFLVRVSSGQPSGSDASAETYRERINVNVICAVSNPASVREQRRAAAGAMGYVRRLLSGQRVEAQNISRATLVYDGWEDTYSGTGLSLMTVSFYLDTYVDLSDGA